MEPDDRGEATAERVQIDSTGLETHPNQAFKMFLPFMPRLGIYLKEIILDRGKHGNMIKSKNMEHRLHFQRLSNDSGLANRYFTFIIYGLCQGFADITLFNLFQKPHEVANIIPVLEMVKLRSFAHRQNWMLKESGPELGSV